MSAKNGYQKTHSSWKAFFSKSTLIAWILFFIVGGLFPRSVYGNQIADNAHLETSYITSSDDLENFLHYPYSPIEITPSWEKSDTSDDSDDFDEDYNTSYSVCLFQPLPSDKILSVIPKAYNQNRREIALFVLHHSWRNFIS